MTGTTSATPPPGVTIPAPHPMAPRPGTVMPPHYRQCFGCGDGHPSGLHLRVTVGEGLTISAEFVLTEDHQGAPGLAHGGVLAAAFDEALGYLLWLLHTPAVTGRLETDFLTPVPVGAELLIEAECAGVAGRKIYTRAVGRIGDSEAVRARGLFIAVPLAHFADHGWADVEAAHPDQPASYNP